MINTFYQESWTLKSIKNLYVICMKNKICTYVYLTLKQALSYESILKKRRIIKFNQIAWLKSNIDMKTKITARAKDGFEKKLL